MAQMSSRGMVSKKSLAAGGKGNGKSGGSDMPCGSGKNKMMHKNAVTPSLDNNIPVNRTPKG